MTTAHSPAGDASGMMIVHDWLGLSDFTRERRRDTLAKLGYVAFAADIYGEGRSSRKSRSQRSHGAGYDL